MGIDTAHGLHNTLSGAVASIRWELKRKSPETNFRIQDWRDGSLFTANGNKIPQWK